MTAIRFRDPDRQALAEELAAEGIGTRIDIGAWAATAHWRLSRIEQALRLKERGATLTEIGKRFGWDVERAKMFINRARGRRRYRRTALAARK